MDSAIRAAVLDALTVTELLLTRTTLVWLGLIAATGLSWQFGHGFGFGENVHYATAAILAISFVKIRYVFLDFMELRSAPLALRLAFEGWAVGACLLLIGLYWLGVTPG